MWRPKPIAPSSRLRPVRVVLLLASATVILLTPAGALAQPVDQELKDLVPDSAVADPESWATQTPAANAPAAQPGTPAVPAAPDPSAPLAELPGLTVPWPETLSEPPALASLPAELDVAEALASEERQPRPDAALQGDEERVGNHLTLVFPEAFRALPEREAFVDRFRQLSALRKYDTDKDTIAQVSARARADKDLLERLLRVYGYYDANVTQTVGNLRAAGDTAGTAGTGDNAADAAVRFFITPGERYRFGVIDLGNLAATGPDYPAFQSRFPVKSGEPLDNDRIVAARDSLDTDLGEQGYAFAKVGEPDLLVDHKRSEGDLTIPTEPGGKYHFGHVISQQPRFLSSHHLEDIARFEHGDLYQRTDQEDLKRAILATGLVASVTVTPREVSPPPAPGQTGEVALDVGMIPGPLRTIAGLAGYDTADGLRLEANWEHRNFFPPEGMLRVRGIVGTKEQLVGTTVRWNNFHGRDQVLTVDVYGNTVNRDAYSARTIAFTTTFEKMTTLLFQKPWTWSVGLEVLATQERESVVLGQAVPRNTYFVAALPLRGSFDRSDDLLDPTRGWRASLRLSPEISKQRGEPSVKYARIQADASAYFPVSDKVVIAGRTRVGSIPGTDIVNIAPSRRFYAGGGGSVRGYGYQQIGPRDTANAPSGGRSLVEFGLEARVGTGMFGGALQLVPFIDAGSVSASVTPTLSGMRYGAGLGFRYKTGFGPIRLDIGTPLNPRPGDSRVTVSVALGQAF